MLQRVGRGIGSGSVSEWGPASSGVVRDAAVHTTAGTPGLGDTSVLPSQVLCSFLVLCLCKLTHTQRMVVIYTWVSSRTGAHKGHKQILPKQHIYQINVPVPVPHPGPSLVSVWPRKGGVASNAPPVGPRRPFRGVVGAPTPYLEGSAQHRARPTRIAGFFPE